MVLNELKAKATLEEPILNFVAWIHVFFPPPLPRRRRRSKARVFALPQIQTMRRKRNSRSRSRSRSRKGPSHHGSYQDFATAFKKQVALHKPPGEGRTGRSRTRETRPPDPGCDTTGGACGHALDSPVVIKKETAPSRQIW